MAHNDVDFYDALKGSYGNREARRNIESKGYQYDKDLSNDNQQIYYNPKSGKLLNTIAGTHNLSDVGTDLYLGLGHLKDTNRYKQAEKTLEAAKHKYNPTSSMIASHSLGGSIGQALSSKVDKAYTLDSGYTIGQKTKGTSYRSQGDAVSLLGANAKHQNIIKHGTTATRNKGLITGGLIGGPLGAIAGAAYDALNNHNVNLVKN
jgi:hypothetical protein